MIVSNKTKILSITLTAVTLCTAIFWIAHKTVYQFAHASDNEYFGKKQSTLTREIREELLEQPDASLVHFTTEDDVNLTGFLFRRPKATINILLCHGYKGCKEFLYNFPALLPEANLLMFDFRACGQSEGTYTSLGYHEYKDVKAAAQFLKQHTDDSLPFVIIGISMGGAATLRAASKDPNLAACYIIDSTFSDLRSMFLRGYNLRIGLPYYPFFPVIRALFHYFANCDIDNVDSKNAVKNIAQPIYFIHSCDDGFIPPENSIKLYANAQNPLTKIWIAPRCRHGALHLYHGKLYRSKLAAFLQQAIDFDLNAEDDSEQDEGEEA